MSSDAEGDDVPGPAAPVEERLRKLEERLERVDELEQRVEELESQLESAQRYAEVSYTALQHLLDVGEKGVDGDSPIVAASDQPFVTDGDLQELDEDVDDRLDPLRRDRSSILRRLTAVEEEIGVEADEVLAIAHGGSDGPEATPLERLIKHGPEAVTDDPSAVHRRAKALAENWNEWGKIRSDAYKRERRLASKGHNLKTHLEAELDESLQWNQVYRAMEKVEELSNGLVELTRGSERAGRYVLVHQLPERAEDSG